MELLQIALVGGVLALDGTSLGQFMVSRPLVAGVLTGWVLGDPALGLLVGAILELYLLVSFPSGGARFPEGATATVVAVAVAAAAGSPGGVPLGVAAGLIWGQVGGWSISWLRRANGRFVPEPDAENPERLMAAHIGAMVLDLARGTLVTLVGAASGRWAVQFFAGAWPLDSTDSAGLLLVGGAVSAGIFLRDLGGFRRRKFLLAAGVALGLLGARLL
ncbi:MAG TPA: PTS sugar transporter subunit IIC [Longimicrobiales bacterium]|nr:PTS sugar transporter subunit IIC [Longimicrobiales bacterium]